MRPPSTAASIRRSGTTLLDKVGAEGRARGVNATPTFFINGQKIEGAAAYEVFKAQIDGLLNAAQ